MVVVFGGEPVIEQLSGEQHKSFYSFFYVICFLFHNCMFLYKKLALRKMPSVQKMQSYVVENFLNLNSLLTILGTMLLAVLARFLHARQTRKNQTSTDEEDILEGSYRSLALLVIVETLVQIGPFVRNQALR